MPANPRLPHARGGVSISGSPFPSAIWSSPRSWGCFLIDFLLMLPCCVFPTLVGVFPDRGAIVDNYLGLPHARGGVSLILKDHHPWALVFPTLVGVFRRRDRVPGDDTSLPHARGGVSQGQSDKDRVAQVFPTLVGVFPASATSFGLVPSLPHARGGVSAIEYMVDQMAQVFPTLVGVFPQSARPWPHWKASSPRSWGCFCAACRV